MDSLARCNACIYQQQRRQQKKKCVVSFGWTSLTFTYMLVDHLWCMGLHVRCCTSHQITYCLTKAVLFVPYYNCYFICVHSFLACLAFFFNHHDCSRLSLFFFLFSSVHNLVSTVACSLACASWLFQHDNSLSITEIYITTQVSDIYGSFCAILCLFLYLFSVCCFALYLWLYGIKKFGLFYSLRTLTV